MSACRLGVLAFGDSITNGGGELQWGVALQSWALWVARGLGLPYTPHAQDGATVQDVVASQIPQARTDVRYDLGCLYVGANDVRLPSWDRDAFERDHRSRARLPRRALRARADRHRPARPRPTAAGRARCSRPTPRSRPPRLPRSALVLDLRDFGARNLMMADHVHPTAFGQIAIAERALDLLSGHGLEPRLRPSSLISYETSARRAPARRPHLHVPAREDHRAGGADQRFCVSSSTSTPSCLSRRGT